MALEELETARSHLASGDYGAGLKALDRYYHALQRERRTVQAADGR
jgi:hypothetical protein